jgi:hypothetical protein
MSILGELTLLFLLICLGFSAYYIYREKHINKTKMSFKESLDLVGLPIVTFYQYGNKYNFLLDSGSANSCINKDALDTIKYSDTGYVGNIFGCEAVLQPANVINIDLFYKDSHFNTNIMTMDLKDAFNIIKNESGVTITGILGSDFLSKYKYVMDFKDNIAYIK